MHGHVPSQPPRFASWSPVDVVLAFLFALLFGGMVYFLAVAGQMR